MRELLIIGTGGCGRETLEAAREMNRHEPTWQVLGFLDDDSRLHGTVVDGFPVIGRVRDIGRFPRAQVVVTTGNPDNFTTRYEIVTRLGLPADRYGTIVHPAASIPPGSHVGPGTIVLAGVVATTPIAIGSHVVIMPGVVLTHDDRVGDFATLASGARLAGGVSVSQGAYVGAGALIREHRSIGSWALVGMGAGVTCDVPDGEVWAGLPARYLRRVRVLPDVFDHPEPAAGGHRRGCVVERP